MRAAIAIFFAASGLVAAQSSAIAVAPQTSPATSVTTEESGCGSAVDLIIQSCLGTENAQLAACAPADWSCMCTQITNVVTCYNNCPTDPNAFAAQQRQTSYCNAAKLYGTSSSVAAAAATTAAAEAIPSIPVAAAAAAATAATTITTGPASTSAATTSPTTNAMAHLAAPAAGAMAAVFAVVAFL